MALYLGGSKRKLMLNGNACHLNLLFIKPIISGIKLLSSDNYILKDSNGIYLIAKDGE